MTAKIMLMLMLIYPFLFKKQTLISFKELEIYEYMLYVCYFVNLKFMDIFRLPLPPINFMIFCCVKSGKIMV